MNLTTRQQTGRLLQEVLIQKLAEAKIRLVFIKNSRKIDET